MKSNLLLFIFLIPATLCYGQFYPLIFNFDTTENVYIDTTLNNNIWQIGKPQKIVFDSAYTFPNAILTDSVNVYPTNNISEFIVKTPTYFFAGWGGVNMSFMHKFDTDTLTDGGTILISSNGVNWVNLLNSSGLYSTSIYSNQDSVSSLSDVGISGHSNNWEQTYTFWNCPPVDTLWVKFRFASDNNQTNKEGWMIDSLIFHYNLGIGINESFQKRTSLSLSPNPATTELRITPDASGRIESVEVFDVVGQKVVSLTPSPSPAGEGSASIDVSELASGIYFVKVRGEKQERVGKFVKQ